MILICNYRDKDLQWSVNAFTSFNGKSEPRRPVSPASVFPNETQVITVHLTPRLMKTEASQETRKRGSPYEDTREAEVEEEGPPNCSCPWARGPQRYLNYSIRFRSPFWRFSVYLLRAQCKSCATSRPKANKGAVCTWRTSWAESSNGGWS